MSMYNCKLRKFLGKKHSSRIAYLKKSSDLVRGLWSSLRSDIWGHLKTEEELTGQIQGMGSGRGLV